MNILCRMIGHSMYHSSTLNKTYCKRGGCNHTETLVWDSGSPMPKCKPPKELGISKDAAIKGAVMFGRAGL